MSRRNKLLKFSQILAFPNVYENYDPREPSLVWKDNVKVERKGQWKTLHFEHEHPLTLELACGRGEYTLDLARMYPNRNFIGVDVKGARIWKGARIALEESLNNVAFLRTRIEQIAFFFEPEEVDEIWITFPDPFLRNSKANRRLTAPNFIEAYRQILRKGGLVHLKTDEVNLYEYTLNVLNEDQQVKILYQDDDIYSKELPFPELATKTYYEKMHLAKGKTIKYVRFTIN